MKENETQMPFGLLDKARPSSETFRVPDGFFNDLPDQIIADESRFKVNNEKPKFNRFNIAAVFSVLALSATLIYQQSQKNDLIDEPSSEDLALYIVLEGTSQEELAQQVIPEQLDYLSDENHSDEIYETYLLEHEIDINHINDEL
ncbi:MAG: hypothetical protein ACK5DJ_08725 [Bacteroidota bacterium]|jgi:hypothetical protein